MKQGEPRTSRAPLAPVGVAVERGDATVGSPFRDRDPGTAVRIHWPAAPRWMGVVFGVLAAWAAAFGAYCLSPASELGNTVERNGVVAAEWACAIWLLWAAVGNWRNLVQFEIRDRRLHVQVGPVRVPGLVGRPVEVALDDIASVTVVPIESAHVVVVHTKRGAKLQLPFRAFDRSIPEFVAREIEAAASADAEPRARGPG